MLLAVPVALQKHLQASTGLPPRLGKRVVRRRPGSFCRGVPGKATWCAAGCRAGWWTERESLGLCKVDFSHSWGWACRFYYLCSPAALTLMNDTCIGPFSSIKTGQLTVCHTISIKLSYSPKQGGHNPTATWEQSLASAKSPVVPANCFGECLTAQAKSMSATTPMT